MTKNIFAKRTTRNLDIYIHIPCTLCTKFLNIVVKYQNCGYFFGKISRIMHSLCSTHVDIVNLTRLYLRL